jgi:hypothetical protein
MPRLHRVAPLAAALVALGGCGDLAVAPPETGDVTVRVYLDRDPASPGTFTAGDSALANVQLTLLAAGTLTTQAGVGSRTATTNAQGLAVFSGVPAGQYSVGLTAPLTIPGGVLTGAGQPVVVVPIRALGSTPALAEFRFALFPGRVTGLVFRDIDGNGAFDPATDATAPGLAVRLTADSAGTQTIASTTLAANATYAFENVAPGTYFVQFAAPAGFSFGTAGTSRRVVVAASQASALNATYATVTTPIATVRTLAVGTPVVIAGTLTSRPGQMGTGTTAEVWIQDATGGVALFGGPTADSTRLLIGTRVEVTAAVAAPFNGQFQLGTATAPPTYLVLGPGTPIAPVAQTGAQIAARTLEGRLVSLAGFRVTTIGGGTGAAFTVTGTTTDGQTIQVRVGSNLAGITRASFAVGSTYTVTGVLSQFNATAQIKPRLPADIVLTP